MQLELLKNEIEALLVGLRLLNHEMGRDTGLIFDYDKMTIRDANLNKVYSKLSETIYLDEHQINKINGA